MSNIVHWDVNHPCSDIGYGGGCRNAAVNVRVEKLQEGLKLVE